MYNSSLSLQSDEFHVRERNTGRNRGRNMCDSATSIESSPICLSFWCLPSTLSSSSDGLRFTTVFGWESILGKISAVSMAECDGSPGVDRTLLLSHITIRDTPQISPTKITLCIVFVITFQLNKKKFKFELYSRLIVQRMLSIVVPSLLFIRFHAEKSVKKCVVYLFCPPHRLLIVSQ